MSLYEVSDIIRDTRDLVRGGDPILIIERSATRSLDDVTAIGAFSGQKVLERAAPNRRHEPIFAENCHDLFGIEPGAAASRQQMMVIDLSKPIAPFDAR